MRPLVKSYGVISTRTLSPASTRMRFLRMRPAVWAMISCSFSSLTRNVAFGSNSVTTPGNSKSSSFAIRYLTFGKQGRARRRPEGAQASGITAVLQLLSSSLSFVGPRTGRKALPDPPQQLIAHISIRVQPLLTAALDRSRIRGGPIFDVGGERSSQLEGLVVRFG